jgi:hypothetical protein
MSSFSRKKEKEKEKEKEKKMLSHWQLFTKIRSTNKTKCFDVNGVILKVHQILKKIP